MRWLICTFLVLCLFESKAQPYLNDTIWVNQWGTYMNHLKEIDSGYLCVGMASKDDTPGNPLQFLSGVLSFDGEWETRQLDYDTSQDQRAAFSLNSIVENDQGNIVHFYRNCGNGGCYPRLKEVTPSGTIVRDTIYSGVIDSLKLNLFDFNNMYYNEFDDTYSLLTNTMDTAKFNQGDLDFGNLLYLKVAPDFTILDTILFADPSQIRSYVHASGVMDEAGNSIIMVQDELQAGTDPDEYSRMTFYEIDFSGNTQFLGHYEPRQKSILPFSLLKTFDDHLVFTYMAAELDQNDWLYINHLCKLDMNLSAVWDIPLNDYSFPAPVGEISQFRVIETVDSMLVVAGGGLYDDTTGVQLTKVSSGGEILWQRSIEKPIYGDAENFVSITEVEIRDVIENSKGGFTMIGNLDELIFSGPNYSYGYLLETNCLGYRSAPVSGFQHEVQDNFNVVFYNESEFSGSYTWEFNDGTPSIVTNSTDSIAHSFSDFGPYTVTLIAQGCGAEADTISYEINPVLHTDPSSVIDGDFTIFPNPVESQEKLFVYLSEKYASSEDLVLSISDLNGKWVQNIALEANQLAHKKRINIGAGLYQVTLFVGDTPQSTRKLVVL